VDLSGIIFVVLALAWAVYLIPKALKQHDEVARTRSIDRFSSATRVLARREPVNRRDARLVVRPPAAPARAVPSVAAPAASSVPVTPPAATVTLTVEPVVSRARLAARRTAARRAARRRRRILTFLLACDAVVAVAVHLTHTAWTALAVPVGLTLVYLVLCRTLVRRETKRDGALLLETGPASAEPSSPSVEPSSVPVQPASVESDFEPVAEVEATGTDEHGVADFDETEDTIGIPADALHAALSAGSEPTAERETLWDPLPVTLPTYVTKPKAKRTVRTIDLGEPGTWTSGRTAEDAEIAARAADEAPEAGSADGGQRAVGS
jgi:hypothetical protein